MEEELSAALCQFRRKDVAASKNVIQECLGSEPVRKAMSTRDWDKAMREWHCVDILHFAKRCIEQCEDVGVRAAALETIDVAEAQLVARPDDGDVCAICCHRAHMELRDNARASILPYVRCEAEVGAGKQCLGPLFDPRAVGVQHAWHAESGALHCKKCFETKPAEQQQQHYLEPVPIVHDDDKDGARVMCRWCRKWVHVHCAFAVPLCCQPALRPTPLLEDPAFTATQSVREREMQALFDTYLAQKTEAGDWDRSSVEFKVVEASVTRVTTQVEVNKAFVGAGEDHPRAFACSMASYFLAQIKDGVELVLLAMLVREYDHRCPLPNTNRVQIEYLDSLPTFAPSRPLRGALFKSFLMAYLTTCQTRGFEIAHVWSCPPEQSGGRNQEYIFLCRPTTVSIHTMIDPNSIYPPADHLRGWYKDVWRQLQEGGVLLRWDNFYDAYIDPLKDAKSRLPSQWIPLVDDDNLFPPLAQHAKKKNLYRLLECPQQRERKASFRRDHFVLKFSPFPRGPSGSVPEEGKRQGIVGFRSRWDLFSLQIHYALSFGTPRAALHATYTILKHLLERLKTK